MSDIPVPSPGGLIVPTVYEVPALEGTPTNPIGQPIAIAARGGSIINSGTVSIFISSTSNPLDTNAIELQPGGTIPWPAGVASWAWAIPGSVTTGDVIVIPLQLPYSPGAITGQPVVIIGTVPVDIVAPSPIFVNGILTGQNKRMVSIVNASSNGALLPAEVGVAWRLHNLHMQANTPTSGAGPTITAGATFTDWAGEVNAIDVWPGAVTEPNLDFGDSGLLLETNTGIAITVAVPGSMSYSIQATFTVG